MNGAGIGEAFRGRGPLDTGVKRAIGAAITLAALVVCGCAGGPVRVPASGSASVVPWTDVPGKAMGQRGASPAVRSCRAGDLEVTVGAAGAYHGQATQEIQLTNGAGDACFLASVPSLTLLFDDGSQQSASSGRFRASRIDLQPGQSALVLVGTPGSCPGAGPSRDRVATRMGLGLAGDGSVQVQGVYLDAQCGAPSIALFEAGDAAIPTSVPQSVLMSSINAPQTAARGQVLHYTVTLVNPGAQAVPLTPCPSYSQSLSQLASGGSRSVHGTWLLNCAAAGEVPGNGNVTFEMQLSVPSDLTAGPAKLYWNLEVANGAGAGTGITVQ